MTKDTLPAVEEQRQMLEQNITTLKRQSFSYFMEMEAERAKHPKATADTKILVTTHQGAQQTTYGARMSGLQELKRDADAAIRRFQEMLADLPAEETDISPESD